MPGTRILLYGVNFMALTLKKVIKNIYLEAKEAKFFILFGKYLLKHDILDSHWGATPPLKTGMGN